MRVLKGHTDVVYCVCSLGDGRVLSASGDWTLRVWNATTGAVLRTLHGHTDSVLSVCSLGDGRVVSASEDTTLRVWDLATSACVRLLEGQAGIAYSVFALGDGRVVSASWDQTLRVWAVASGVFLETTPRGSPRAAELIFLAPSDINARTLLHCGRTPSHFAPWSALPLNLDAEEALGCSLFTHPCGRRTAIVFTRGGTAHTLDLVVPASTVAAGSA
jgi:WD40 repeat protein